MSLLLIGFGAFAALVLAAGLFLALTRRVVQGVFALFVLLFGVAGLFVFAGGDFLAVVQLIVYVGGVLVLLLFGVMLSQRLEMGSDDPRAVPRTAVQHRLPALGAVLLLGALLWRTYAPVLAQPGARAPLVSVEAFGVRLLTDALLPFELLSVLLLVALVGAAYLSRRPDIRPRDMRKGLQDAAEESPPFLP